MCTVRNDTGVFFSAKSGEAKKRGEWFGIGHAQLVEHVENGRLERAVAPALEARLGFLDARVFALVEVDAQKAPGLLRGLDHRVGVLDRGGGGLGHDHVQAGVERATVGAQCRWSGVLTCTASSFDLRQQFLVVGKPAVGQARRPGRKPVAVLLVRVGHGANFQQRRIMAVEIKVLVNLAHDGAGADDAEAKFGFHIKSFGRGLTTDGHR